jgi:two-component system response regulator HydG
MSTTRRRLSSPFERIRIMSKIQAEIRVLMVDDEREFLQAVEPGLARRGFKVATAESGRRALELLLAEGFDVVVLDVKMPGIDGVDTFREIKRIAPGLPVILLTGHGNIQQAFDTSREGVHEYLTKPCEVERLAQTLREAVARSAPPPTEQGMEEDEVRLLLVDDDLEFVRSITPGLERRGVRVSAASDGVKAIESIRSRRFDVALVDVVMPGIDGLTLLDRLKEEDPSLQVVILTGNPRVDDVRRGLKAGALDYLTKPQTVEDLYQVLRSARNRKRELENEGRMAEADRILTDRPE